MTFHGPTKFFTPNSAVQLYKGITQTRPKSVYTAIRILCTVKRHLSKQPGIQAVSDQSVLIQIKSVRQGGQKGKAQVLEEAREVIAKVRDRERGQTPRKQGYETDRANNGLLATQIGSGSPQDTFERQIKGNTKDLAFEYVPEETSFLGGRPEYWVSRARKRLEERAMKNEKGTISSAAMFSHALSNT
ncbi:hypothetical protein PG994_012423 [Apiospora phragmitis]|uniref:Uncharacterized protein n=1 Tax=Apiospora phragmitis TaxID=2905665 RepID=A0ABR1TVX1_9PEZI